MIDIRAARADTRGTERVTHFNNAGSSLMPRPVADTVVDQLRREEEIGGYEAAAEASERLENVYSSLARLIRATAGEIVLAESGSTAWLLAVSGIPLTASRVLLGRTEYSNNVRALQLLSRRTGLELVALEDDSHGQLDIQHLQRELDRGDVAFVALTHVPMGSGLVNPAAEVGRRCRDAGVIFVLDACQSVGQMPLDVNELGCDILAGTGRKFLRGPRGTAFVYIRQSLLERFEPALCGAPFPAPFSGGGRAPAQARLLESWEASIAGRLGLGRAVDYALEIGLEPARERILTLAHIMRSRLSAIPTVRVHDRGLVKCGLVTFSVQGRTAEQVKSHLAAQRINVSAAALPPSTANALLRPSSPGGPTTVRASVHYYNTDTEIDSLIRALVR